MEQSLLTRNSTPCRRCRSGTSSEQRSNKPRRLDALDGSLVMARDAVARSGGSTATSRGNSPIDRESQRDAIQDDPNDLTREKIRERLQGLSERQQAELVASMWIGRGDAEPEEWENTIELARELKEGPTPRYLLRHPLVAEHWAEGAARLGVQLPIARGHPSHLPRQQKGLVESFRVEHWANHSSF